MLPRTTSIWQRDSQPNASGKPGAVQSKLIRDALEADDEATLQAALGAQPFLSGMSSLDRDYFIGLYHAKKQPHLVERRDVMKRVLNLLNDSGANGSAFHAAFAKMVGAEPGVVRAIEKADTAAKAALNINPTT